MAKNTTWKHVLERMTTSERDFSQDGENAIIFNTDTGQFEVWNGSAWVGTSGNGVAFGFLDYNDDSGDLSLSQDTWTDVPNTGNGAFTNKTYAPSGVSEVLDTSTGYLDFSELGLGSEIIVRNDFTVTPNTNNALLQARYVLGQGAGEYALNFWSERLDSGSGIPYQRVIPFPIYMGDENTKGGVGKLQVRLSTTGTLNNAGSYISIKAK